MVQFREADYEITWVLKGNAYEKTTTIVERIPASDVVTCAWCGDPIFNGRSDRKFCNRTCRNAFWRNAQKRS